MHCDGGHPVFFKSCSKHPKQLLRKAEEDRTRTVQESNIRTGVSFSAVAGGSSREGISQRVETLQKIITVVRGLILDIVRNLNG